MHHKHHFVSATLIAVAVAAFLSGCGGSDSDNVLPTGQAAGDVELSSFYRWNDTLPNKPGVPLRREAQPAQTEISAASLQERILYTSEDWRWKSGIVPVSGTVYLPKGTPPAGGWPIVAWAHGTVGVSDSCAPSWTLHAARDATYMNRWLEQGFAVVATDYQGLGGPGPHPYLFWEAEGRSVLDSVRAALAAYPGQLANNLVITGQSQGSGGSLGASRLAPSYAPELRLRATIATGVVSNFPDGPFQVPAGSPDADGPARFTMLRLIGGGLPDSGPSAESLVTQQGLQLLNKARTSCINDVRALETELGLSSNTAFSVSGSTMQATLIASTAMSSVKLPAPTFLGTGLADRTTPPLGQYAAARALCAAGSSILWKTYEGNSHNGTVNTAFPDELSFVQTVLSGAAPAFNCNALQEPGAPGVEDPSIPFNS